MPPANFSFSEVSESTKNVGQIGHADVEAQLNNQADVSQAHQFFQPKADGGLPNLSIQNDGGASAAAAHKAMMGGGEQAIGHAMTSAEHGILAALKPGAEQLSPLIQMMMKLPGLTGIMSNIFEFFQSLIEGSLMEALNPMNWAEHAAEAFESIAHGIEHLTDSIELIGSNGPVMHFDGQFFHPAGTQAMGAMQLHNEAVGGGAESALDPANVGAPVNDVDLSNAVFEKTSGYTITDYHQNATLGWNRTSESIALSPDSYKPTMGGTYQPPTTTAQSASSSTVNIQHSPHNVPSSKLAKLAGKGHGHAPGHGGASHFRTSDVAIADRTQIAQSSDSMAGGQYTIQRGDSLWDIAKRQLGDSSRWSEIYKANADVIGSNPDIIQPGTVLKMPDATSIASNGAEAGKYIVQPGDNLWDIAKHNLGGGEHWGDIYKANVGTIGSNPGMIHPGQTLDLGGGADGGTLAQAPVTDAAPIAAAPQQIPTHVAQSMPAQVHSAPSASEVAAANGDLSSAPNPAFASQPGRAMLQMQTPELAPVGPGAASAASLPPSQGFSNAASVGSEQVIDQSTGVPAAYSSNDGSLFFKQNN